MGLYFEKKYKRELFEKEQFKEVYKNITNANSFFLFRIVDGKYNKSEKIIVTVEDTPEDKDKLKETILGGFD